MKKRIVVIGGGPGGYACAIRAAQLGAQVTLAEMGRVGGTCLNVGCIPTKALLHTAAFYRAAAERSVPGVAFEGVSLDWPAALRHKDEIVGRLTGGVASLLRHNGVTVRGEAASLLPGRRVKIGADTLEADAVILASGSESVRLNFPGCDLPGVIDSTGALSLEKVPSSLLIVGGGVIGIEFAALYSALETKVTVVEMLPEILPPVDEEISGMLRELLRAGGVEIYTGAKLTGVERSKQGLAAAFERDGRAQRIEAEQVLVAVGRRARTGGLNLEEAGVKLTRGAVEVDERFRTSVPGVYAVGDCNGKILLAHAAMAQGIAAAEDSMGVTSRYNPKIIPSCVYCTPEISGVGMTERQAKEAGIDYAVGRFPLSGNGKSMIDGAGGMMKIIADRALGEVLGVHMIGPHVTELIAEAALCMSLEGTVEDIVGTVHAHPTVSEAFCEAAISVFGKPIHGI